MASIFFNISAQQEKEVKAFMKEEGYTSKAEFFRFLLKFFKYHKTPEDIRFEDATAKLAHALKKLEKKGKIDLLDSLEDQLADV